MRGVYKILFQVLFILNALCSCLGYAKRGHSLIRNRLNPREFDNEWLSPSSVYSTNYQLRDTRNIPAEYTSLINQEYFQRNRHSELEDYVWRRRGDIFRALYQLALEDVTPDIIPVQRRKRPGGPGVLGLDNIDFAASTLDRARGRGSIPGSGEAEAPPNLPMSFGGSPSTPKGSMFPMRGRPTSPSLPMSLPSSGRTESGLPSGQRRLSMDVSVKDLRKMLEMIKAGR